MPNGWFAALAFVAALGSGLIAGVFFAFSTFVMRALARLPAGQAVAAMQAINVTVLNAWFLVAFVGTAAACAVLAAAACFRLGAPDAHAALVGGVLYVVGTFAVTMGRNVPLNDALDRAAPDAATAGEAWRAFLGPWVGWNHVRTAAALAASAALLVAWRGAGAAPVNAPGPPLAHLLTGGLQFDSYRTVSLSPRARERPHGRPTDALAPGQFERIAKALADPRRFAMLETVGAEPECANQALCEGFPVSKGTISHHLRELVQAGLVEAEREGQYVHYRVCADVVQAYAAELVRRAGGRARRTS